MLKSFYKINAVLFICLLLAENCNSYDWEKGLNSDKNVYLQNKEFTTNLDDLLNYNKNSDFSENNEKFEDLLTSIGFENEEEFDINFDPWGDLNVDKNLHNDQQIEKNDNIQRSNGIKVDENENKDCYDVTEETPGGQIFTIVYEKPKVDRTEFRGNNLFSNKVKPARMKNRYGEIYSSLGEYREPEPEPTIKVNYRLLFKWYEKIFESKEKLFRYLKAQNQVELYKKYTTPCN